MSWYISTRVSIEGSAPFFKRELAGLTETLVCVLGLLKTASIIFFISFSCGFESHQAFAEVKLHVVLCFHRGNALFSMMERNGLLMNLLNAEVTFFCSDQC